MVMRGERAFTQLELGARELFFARSSCIKTLNYVIERVPIALARVPMLEGLCEIARYESLSPARPTPGMLSIFISLSLSPTGHAK